MAPLLFSRRDAFLSLVQSSGGVDRLPVTAHFKQALITAGDVFQVHDGDVARGVVGVSTPVLGSGEFGQALRASRTHETDSLKRPGVDTLWTLWVLLRLSAMFEREGDMCKSRAMRGFQGGGPTRT